MAPLRYLIFILQNQSNGWKTAYVVIVMVNGNFECYVSCLLLLFWVNVLVLNITKNGLFNTNYTPTNNT